MSTLDDILGAMRAKSGVAPPPKRKDDAPTGPIGTRDARVPGAPPQLDVVHRVKAAGANALDYRFRCATLRLAETEVAALCADCEGVCSSHWLAASAQPRCALERLAHAIFVRHTEGVQFDPARSGAEWWAQVRTGGHRQEGIEFHWDVDEHLCDLPGGGGVHVHPHLSTVTYLSRVGAPTLVLDAGSPKAATKQAVAGLYGAIPSGALSFPRLGKSVVFDGAKLHGAVACSGHGAPPGVQRVTFLVNVWLGHQPHAVEPLPPALAASLSQVRQALHS